MANDRQSNNSILLISSKVQAEIITEFLFLLKKTFLKKKWPIKIT